MDGTIENIDITDGILLTTSEFVSQEDIEMTTTHDDLSLFQISFCIDGNMEWSYINNEVVHQFQIAAQQSQVRYGTFKECRSRISGNRKFKGISITLDEKIFEQIFTCIKIRGALYDTRKTAPVRVYTYTPNISKILSEILACHFCDEMKKLYLQGKIFELIAVYCDEVICKSPTNDFGIRISVEDYNALLKAREFIGENFAHPLTIPIVAKAIAINEQKLKDGFKRCFGVTVNDYVVEKRLEAAIRLLKTGKHTVQEVTWMVGYGVSFTAKAGTVTALVGPSGSGKSTLAKLIARFWDVSAGAVTVGGADIRNLPLSELSEKISYVSQDNFLFNMSLRDNIRIGKPDATDAEVERAASLARCDDFIARFPKGYDTNAGDAGARLSGGERQRLAIARAILKDAPIIILDEATAFTDPENEDKLQQSIDHLTKGKTLIVIAHRLSTIMYADKILVLEDGAISAEGTHEQLLSSSQTYLDMWKAHISAMDWSMNKEVEILC